MGEFAPNPHYLQCAEAGQASAVIPAILSRSEQFYYARLLSTRLDQAVAQLQGYTERQEGVFEIRALAGRLRQDIRALREKVGSAHEASSARFRELISTARVAEAAGARLRNVSEARALLVEARECMSALGRISLAVEANIGLRGAFERALDTATGLCSGTFSEDRMGDFRRACSELEAQQNAVPLRDVVFGLVTLDSEALGRISGLLLASGLRRQCRLLKTHVLEAVLKPALNIWLADLQDKTPAIGRAALLAAERSLEEADRAFAASLEEAADCSTLWERLEGLGGPGGLSPGGSVGALSGGVLSSVSGASGASGGGSPSGGAPAAPQPDLYPNVLSDYLAYCEMLGFSAEAREYLISARVQQLPRARATLEKLLEAGRAAGGGAGGGAGAGGAGGGVVGTGGGAGGPGGRAAAPEAAGAGRAAGWAQGPGPASLTPELCALAGFVVTLQLLARQVGGLDQQVLDAVTSRAVGDVEALLDEFCASRERDEEDCLLFCRGASALILLLSSVKLPRQRGQVTILTKDSHPDLPEACHGLRATLNTACFSVYRDSLLSRASRRCSEVLQVGLPEHCARAEQSGAFRALAASAAAEVGVAMTDALVAALRWNAPYCPPTSECGAGILARVILGPRCGVPPGASGRDHAGSALARGPPGPPDERGGGEGIGPKALTTLAVDLLLMGFRTPLQMLLEEYTAQNLSTVCALAHLLDAALPLVFALAGALDVLEGLEAASGVAGAGEAGGGAGMGAAGTAGAGGLLGAYPAPGLAAGSASGSAAGPGASPAGSPGGGASAAPPRALAARPEMAKVLSDMTDMRVQFFGDTLFQILSHGAGEILAKGVYISVVPMQGHQPKPSFGRQLLTSPERDQADSLLGHWGNSLMPAQIPRRKLCAFANTLAGAILRPEDEALVRRFPDMAHLAFLDGLERVLEATANATGTQFPGLIAAPKGVEQFQLDCMQLQSLELEVPQLTGGEDAILGLAADAYFGDIRRVDEGDVRAALTSSLRGAYFSRDAAGQAPVLGLNLAGRQAYSSLLPAAHVMAYMLLPTAPLRALSPGAPGASAGEVAAEIAAATAAVSTEFEQRIGQRFSIMTSLQNVMDVWGAFCLPPSLQGAQLREALAANVERVEARIEQYALGRREVRLVECLAVPPAMQAQQARLCQALRERAGGQTFQRKYPERDRRGARQAEAEESPAFPTPGAPGAPGAPGMQSPVSPALASAPASASGPASASSSAAASAAVSAADSTGSSAAVASPPGAPVLPAPSAPAAPAAPQKQRPRLFGRRDDRDAAKGAATAPPGPSSPLPAGPVGAGTPIVLNADGTVNMDPKGAGRKPKAEKKWGWKRDKST